MFRGYPVLHFRPYSQTHSFFNLIPISFPIRSDSYSHSHQHRYSYSHHIHVIRFVNAVNNDDVFGGYGFDDDGMVFVPERLSLN